LYEAPLAGGLLAPIGVGAGKTLLGILMPMVMPKCKTAVLFVPPGLINQLENEYHAIAEHFRVPSLVLPGACAGKIVVGAPVLHVIPYSRFSLPASTDLLERLAPDLALADECHKLKAKDAARTRRFLRYFADHTDTRLCAWSGTITAKSIKDFAHIIAFALGENSPLPLHPSEVERWAGALDPSEWPSPPGALRAFAEGNEPTREAIRRRIVETKGVVSTRGSASCDATNILVERIPPPTPQKIINMLRDIQKTWIRPDGEELIDALSVAACSRQLACGFYYRWRFPGNPSEQKINAWFAARKDWGRELREKLKHPAPFLDSPRLCANAAERARENYKGDLPVWRSDTWGAWREVKNTITYETEPVWIDEYLARDAAIWATKSRGIVWYDYDAFGRKVSTFCDLPLHSGGKDADEKIRSEKGDRSIVASIKSHHEGRDGLQFLFAEQLVANPPSSGEKWEQLLGRLHRPGQSSDEITTHVYRHTDDMRDAIDRAIVLAKYVEGLTGANQRLLAANVEWNFNASR
jgi:hypothetical protein